MILWFCSSMYRRDPQVTILESAFKKAGKMFLRINPLSTRSLRSLSLTMNQCGDIDVRIKRRRIIVESVLVSRLFRTDCIMRGIDKTLYPTLFRSNAQELLNQTVYALDKCQWFPAYYPEILKADSKINVYGEAIKCGVPTLNAEIGYKRRHRHSIRKSLPYPFNITHKTGCDEEQAVTLYTSTETDSTLGLAWVWQKYIRPKMQVRSVFVEDQHWTASIRIKHDYQHFDLRADSESSQPTANWEPHFLPKEIVFSMQRLMNRLSIKYCCPEFIVGKNGKHYLIDLNPCGDFWGFHNPKITREIATAIIQRL